MLNIIHNHCLQTLTRIGGSFKSSAKYSLAIILTKGKIEQNQIYKKRCYRASLGHHFRFCSYWAISVLGYKRSGIVKENHSFKS